MPSRPPVPEPSGHETGRETGPETGPEAGRDAGRRPRARRVSVATRLAAMIVAITAVTVAITSVVGIRSGLDAADRLLEQRLASIRSAESFELTSYVESTRRMVAALADSPMTADSIDQFATAYTEIQLPDRATLAEQRDELADQIARDLMPALAAASIGPVGPRDLVPETDVGVHLHHLFLQRLLEPDGSLGPTLARDIDDPGGDSRWADVHADLHAHYRTAATRLGAADLYLVAPDGIIVYSVEKAPDFTTNLRIGPHSGGSLASAFRSFVNGARGPIVTDLSPYEPALGRPMWFHAAPVVVDGRFRGMVAIRIGVGPLNEVLAGGPGGTEGFGETGEVYLAGLDNRLRSDPRLYREAPGAYLTKAMDTSTMSEADVAVARGRGSTVLLQRADGDLVEAATTAATTAGSTGTSTGTSTGVFRRVDHLGRDSIMVAAPFVVADLEWVIVAQITAEEAARPVTDYRRLLLLVAAVVVALVTFGAVAWANRVVRPVRLVSERLRERRAGLAALADDPVPTDTSRRHGCDEFQRLVDGFAAMDAQLLTRRDEIEVAHQEWLDVLRSLLPAAVADRIDEGDRAVFDRIPSATVAAVVLHGAEARTGADAGSTTRSSTGSGAGADATIAALDHIAERHGLERVKLVGDTCFLAVGHQQPVLDHARRAVAFARELVAALAEQHAVQPSVGVASGSVNVGLSGSAKLIYDVWGPTVADAYALARSAAPGEVAWTDQTAERLPDDVVDRQLTDDQLADDVVVGGSNA